MKKTFMKFLPIAAAIILATSCSKDGDNGDTNVVTNPEPESTEVATPDGKRVVPFSVTVNTGKSLSKIAYTDTDVEGKMVVLPSFEASDAGMEMVISSAGDAVTGTLTLTDWESGTFSGNLTVDATATDETELTGTITVAATGQNAYSQIGIEDLMGKCGHTYEANFKYGTKDKIDLVDVANSYLEITWTNKGGAEVDINNSGYTLNNDGKIWLMVAPGTKITSTTFGIDDTKNRTAVAGKIHTISRTYTPVTAVSITGAPTDTYIWGSTETIPLAATVTPAEATDQTISWAVTSGPATVNQNGVVTITGMGEVVVTATATADNVSLSCTINVSKDFVDLGITTTVEGNTMKVLWATKNLGADNPWEYGNYYAWGETTGHSLDDGYNFSKDNYAASSITTDLSEDNDAAYVASSGESRMPTKDEFNALLDKCHSVWVGKYDDKTFNGKDAAGYIFYKKKDEGEYTLSDPHIFLPAAGYRYSSVINAGSVGYYWSSSVYSYSSSDAWVLYFYSGNRYMSSYGRLYGRSVRPVRCINSYNSGEGQSGVED